MIYSLTENQSTVHQPITISFLLGFHFFLFIVNVRGHKRVVLFLHQIVLEFGLIWIWVYQRFVQSRFIFQVIFFFYCFFLLWLLYLLNLVLYCLLQPCVLLHKFVLLSLVLFALEVLTQKIRPFLVEFWWFLLLSFLVQGRCLRCHSLMHHSQVGILLQVFFHLCGLGS